MSLLEHYLDLLKTLARELGAEAKRADLSVEQRNLLQTEAAGVAAAAIRIEKAFPESTS